MNSTTADKVPARGAATASPLAAVPAAPQAAVPAARPTSATPSAASEPIGSVFAPEHRRLTLGIVLAILVIAFEAMAVATAMPVAVRELHGLPLYAWGFSGYLTTSLFAMVVAGELCDAGGPRRPLLTGMATFAVGLVVAGTATDMLVFIAGRAVQGLGGGLVIVSLYVVVARSYPDAMRPRVFSAMSSAWVLPSIIGPALAGAVADTWTWRAVFLGVAPVVLVVLVCVRPAMRGLDGSRGAPARTGRKRLALAAAAGAALVQYAGQHLQWSSLAFAAAGLALLVPSLPRLLPAGTLRAARGLPTAILMRGLLAGAFFGAETFVPLMLIDLRGLSTTLAGLSLTGSALGWALGSWLQGRPKNRLPRARLVQLGALLVALGIGGLTLALLPGVPTPFAAAAWALGGMGMGLAMASVSVLTLELSAPQDQGANSAGLQVSDGLGGIVLIGVAGALFASLHTPGAGNAGVFAVIFGSMVAVALLGCVLAPRVRPRP